MDAVGTFHGAGCDELVDRGLTCGGSNDGEWDREVVQRCEGVRVHQSFRWEGRLRPLFVDRGGWVSHSDPGPGGRVRRAAGTEGALRLQGQERGAVVTDRLS